MPMQPAILGTARLGNFRLGYRPAALTTRRLTRARILLAGAPARVRRVGLTIRDVINENPNTCSLTFDGVETPVDAQSLRILINSDDPELLFDGALQDVSLSYVGSPPAPEYPATAIDDTWQANRRRPFGTWTTVSATTIGQYLASIAGVSNAGIVGGLPNVSMILDGSEGISGGFSQLAKLIGGYWKIDDGVAYLFLTDTADSPDAIDDTPGRFLDDPKITLTQDASQLLTRAFGKGHAEPLLAEVAAAETMLPVANAGSWFNPAGGKAMALNRRLDYTGVQVGGGGSLVGPGAAPSVAPTVTMVVGSGLGNGTYQYAYTDVTAGGESLPSPIATITVGPTNSVTAPAAGPTVNPNGSSNANFNAGTALQYGYAYRNATGETVISARTSTTSVTNGIGSSKSIDVTAACSADVSVTLVIFYESHDGGVSFRQFDSVTNVPSTNVTTANLGPGVNGLIPRSNNVAIAGVALGASGTTSRKVYRTAVNAAQLKLQQTIANNTATVGVQDATADGSLGANAPTSDTSGLAQPQGQVNAGSTTILTASAGPFQSGGGWTTTGIRYTGISGNTLTGIPASGPGSLQTTLPYGAAILPAPALTGVTGVTETILPGTPIAIWVQRDDLTAQAAQAAIDAANGVTPADGIYEGPPIVDERRNEASLTALCDAVLALKSTPITTVTYACIPAVGRPLPRSGKLQHFAVTTPAIGPFDLTIQEVTITDLDLAPGLNPKCTVTASNVAGKTLEGLMRQLLTAAGS